MIHILLSVIGLLSVVLLLSYLMLHARLCRLEQRKPIGVVFIPVSKSRRADYEPSMN